MLRIAFISYEYPPDTGKGGIGTYVSQVAKAMAVLGWDVHVFAGSHMRCGSISVEGYQLHHIKCNDAIDFRYKVTDSFSAQHSLIPFNLIESPEINGNGWEIKKKYPQLLLIVRLHAPGYLVEKLKKKYIPFLAKLRFVLGAARRLKLDAGYWRPYNKHKDEDYQFIELADYITAPSEVMKEWVRRHWQIAADKISVMPNLFSPTSALLKMAVVENSSYRRIVFFGRLNVLKGLVNATFAMNEILKEYPGWQFKVIGDDGPGPSAKISMRNWMKMQLSTVLNRVEFIDGVAYEELPVAIAESEIILLPSLFESFSYTCAEAMAAGKAITGSKNAGMADLIENEKSGMLINPYRYRVIVAALKKLIDNDAFRIQLSKNARERIVNVFDANKTASVINDYYLKIAKKTLAKN